MRVVALFAACLAALRVSPVAAHTPGDGTHTLSWSTWTWDPALVLLLAFGLALGALAATSRGVGHWRPGPWRLLAWFSAHGVLFVALVSPLDAASGHLFSAHMVQHLLIIQVAAPLLMLATPWHLAFSALPYRLRLFAGRRLRSVYGRSMLAPLAVWAVGITVLWGWHIPRLYDLAVGSSILHRAEHASLFAAALLIWAVALHVAYPYPARLLLILGTALQTTLLGVLITFSRSVWYESYRVGPDWWSLTPLEDQQLGGLLMWIPGTPLYAFAGAMLFIAWLNAIDRRSRQKDRDRMRLSQENDV